MLAALMDSPITKMNAREDLVGNVSAVGSQIAVKFHRPVDSHLRQLVRGSRFGEVVRIVTIDESPIISDN